MKKGDQLKWQILQHAVELFEENGYVETTTRMIAERANVGRGHLYYYFKKKEDVMRELTSIFFKKIRYFVEQETGLQINDPFLFFSFIIRCHAHFVEDGDYFKTMFIEQNVYDLNYVMGCESYYEILKQLVEETEMTLDEDDLRNSIEIGLMVFNLLMTKKLNGYEIDIDEIPDRVLRHSLLDIEVEPAYIESINKKSRDYFNQMDYEALSVLIYRSDYEEIVKFI